MDGRTGGQERLRLSACGDCAGRRNLYLPMQEPGHGRVGMESSKEVRQIATNASVAAVVASEAVVQEVMTKMVDTAMKGLEGCRERSERKVLVA